MFQLDESSRMVEKMVRGWCEAKLAPRLPALEAGTEMPWALMRELAPTFGVAALAEAAAKKRVAKKKVSVVTVAAPPKPTKKVAKKKVVKKTAAAAKVTTKKKAVKR